MSFLMKRPERGRAVESAADLKRTGRAGGAEGYAIAPFFVSLTCLVLGNRLGLHGTALSPDPVTLFVNEYRKCV